MRWRGAKSRGSPTTDLAVVVSIYLSSLSAPVKSQICLILSCQSQGGAHTERHTSRSIPRTSRPFCGFDTLRLYALSQGQSSNGSYLTRTQCTGTAARLARLEGLCRWDTQCKWLGPLPFTQGRLRSPALSQLLGLVFDLVQRYRPPWSLVT